MLPGPVTYWRALPGTPASRRVSYSLRAMNGVSLAGFRTAVFPVTRAPTVIPVAIASGKLNGETTAQTPNGRSTLIACSFG